MFIAFLKFSLNAVFYLFFFSLILQPGGGNGGGHNPCENPNPPPSCNNVPINNIEFLLLAGILAGAYYIIKNKHSSKITGSDKY